MDRGPQSYVLDWAIVIAAIAIALLLANVNPDYHHFSVLDLSISYPHRQTPKVALWLFIILTIILPILSITLLTIFVRKPYLNTSRASSSPLRTQILPELNAGLLGLGISLGTSTIIATGVKNLTGKPRPDFLAVCQPDLDRIAEFTVGGYGERVSELWVMVRAGICRQQDRLLLNDAHRSFPSGYATSLIYLSLWLCAKFDITLPADSRTRRPHQGGQSEDLRPLMGRDDSPTDIRSGIDVARQHKPICLLFLPYVPLGLAIFVAGTRYFDFRNHGSDVLAGSAVGTATAWFGHSWCLRSRV